ncbi:Serine/threonine protein phosphatase PrpC [Micromonospora citrea]|uniref:Serine/threonine protein phosphatase PrpC n=1 Tax=Micromonospora citrea TaxID=47855 RepID=A0A1C6TPT7_9ACTN|nr:protein phosphatase 2C domain-containing protein [Micromonospora citrea]SCL43825.1 Serine/threonine protein phosphatase PrpC [Micromonospora citrea]
MTPPLRIERAGGSHVGYVRQRNEDSIYLGRSLIAVADGLGGHVAGDVASSTVIEAMRQYDREVDPSLLAATLGQAVNAANNALRERITSDAELAGMGTTLVAMLINGQTAALANIGDSRAYRLHRLATQGGLTTQVTEDHVYGRLVSDAADVPNLPERLARFLDGRPDGRSPDITLLALNPGDRFLLCSDGLSSYVPEHLLHAALANASTPTQTVDRLIAAALDHGGPDNVTVAVIDVQEGTGSD